MLRRVGSNLSWQRSLGVRETTPSRRRPLLPRRPVLLAAVMALALLAFGCTAENDIDNTNNNVILVLDGLAPISDPFGDVITGTGTILDDTLSATFSAHLKAPISTNPLIVIPALQEVVLERYEVTFTRTDGGTAVPAGFTRGIALRVRLTEEGADELVSSTITLVIVPSTQKAQPPISFLVSPGIEPDTNFTNIQVTANITFFGRTLAGNRVVVVGQIGINFANYGDSNS